VSTTYFAQQIIVELVLCIERGYQWHFLDHALQVLLECKSIIPVEAMEETVSDELLSPQKLMAVTVIFGF